MDQPPSVFPRLHPRLQAAIVQRLGWQTLRPVQDLAGSALLDGHNAVVLAPTAGGKTEASVFPALSMLLDAPPRGVGVLYLAPIKALLNNQERRLGEYAQMVGLQRFVWHGDVTSHARRRFLRAPAELLMTTPESLEVMLVSPSVDVDALFCDLRLVIVDEVHALAGTDRGAHLMSVLERLAARAGADVQRVGLSATVGNPHAIAQWLKGSSTRDAVVVDPPSAPARRQLLVIHRPDLGQLAGDAAALGRGQKSLLFCQSRKATEALARALERQGTRVFVHHSSVSAAERAVAEAEFERGQDVAIVCTSTLELGIDVGDLDRVLQHEAPPTVSSFMQRMGRTGRRPGSVANTVFLCESEEAVWFSLAMVALARQGFVEEVPVLRRCWPVVVHQLLAMALAERGVTADAAWTHLQRVPDVAGVTRAEFDALVDWMLAEASLEQVGGRLVLGRTSERRFGRRNFLELYAVFQSPALYTVETLDGAALGSLEQDFVDRLVDETSVFRLGGRGWQVVGVDHGARRVQVVAAAGGKPPTWGGFGGQLYGLALCEAVRDLLRGDAVPAIAHPSAAEVLAASREALRPVFEAGEVVPAEGGVVWWTFAGGRINATLARAFRAVEPGWRVVSSNLRLRFEAEGLSAAAWHTALARVARPALWEDEALWQAIAADLPSYRLSKFQPLMPPWMQRALVAEAVLDVPATARWLLDHPVAPPAWGAGPGSAPGVG